MHKTRFSIFILALFLGGNLLAQSQKELGQLMRNRGEYYFTLNVEDASKIENLGEICSVDGVTGHTVADEAKKFFLELIPLKRGGKPQDVANVVAFLCGPDSDYVTGQVINVCGGFLM